MATYTIVSSTKTPLDPGEINAGGTINVAEGDVFIIDPGADSNTTFDDGGGGPFSIDIQFAASNNNTFDLVFQSGVDPTVDIADGADLSNIALDAQAADSFTLTAGNNVTLGGVDSSQFADSITLGDGFTATADWNFLGGDDVLTVGINADFTASKIKAGLGDDNLTFGDGAAFGEIDTEGGADTLWLGDNITGNKIKAGDGNDFIRIGDNATITGDVDGGGGTDTLNTQTTGLTENSIETTNVVCFAAGTVIATVSGDMPVERLRPGVMVRTLDHGLAPLRWVGRFRVTPDEMRQAARLRPIRIEANALGRWLPQRDLIVSAQLDTRHRPARPFLQRKETVNRLLARHRKNGKPLQDLSSPPNKVVLSCAAA